jgi:hypothetical protein
VFFGLNVLVMGCSGFNPNEKSLILWQRETMVLSRIKTIFLKTQKIT